MATVETVFRVIDRASGPLLRMERQAHQTDRAMSQLGMTTDFLGSKKQQRNLYDTDRAMRTYGSTTDDVGRRVRNLNRDLDQHASRWQRLKNWLGETGAALAGVARIFSTMKLPAMGVAVGVLVQAVGALAGAVVGLLPKIADLGTGVLALGPGLVGLVGAAITAKLAFGGLSKAMSGNEAALKKLTPQARQFVTVLKEYGPVMKQMRESAQSGLFPGLTQAVVRIQRGVPVVNTLLKEMGRTIGGLASQAATRFTSTGFLADLLGIGRAGRQGVARSGAAIINIADGFRQLSAAAIPFFNWFTKGIQNFGEWFNQWAQWQRDSGEFAARLDRTKDSLRTLGQFLGNTWRWMRELGKAARPLGDLLWADANRATKAWAASAGSMQGQIRLTKQFLGMHDAIKAIFTLFDDLVRVIFRMGTSGQLAGITTSLDKMIPKLENFLNLLVRMYGPVMTDLLAQIFDIFAMLTAATGPVQIMLTLIDHILRTITTLIHTVPGLGSALSAAFSVAMIAMFATKLLTVGRAVMGIAAAWAGVEVAAKGAAAAEALAGGIGGAASAGALGGAAALGGVAIAGRSAGGVILPAAATSTGGSMAGAATAGGLGGMLARGGGLRAAGGRLASSVGRVALPVMAALGAYGAATAPRSGSVWNQAQQTMVGGYNTMTGGLYGKLGNALSGGQFMRGLMTPSQLASADVSKGMSGLQGQITALGGEAPTFKQLGKQIDLYRNQIAAWSHTAQPAYQAATAQLRNQLSALVEVNKAVKQRRNEEERASVYKTLRQEGKAWDIYAGKLGPVEATRRTTQDVLTEMAKLQEPGRRLLAQQYSSWLQEEAQRNPKLKGLYDDLQKSITRSFRQLGINIKFVNGKIVEGTQSSWQAIQRAMTDPAERALEQVSASFTAIQEKAVATLTAMGVSPTGARNMVKAIEEGRDPNSVAGAPIMYDENGNPLGSNSGATTPSGSGTMGQNPAPKKKKHALGGRIAGGFGLGDNVNLGNGSMGANGELVVNQHTERRVNYLLGGRTTLGQEVGRETRPHSASVAQPKSKSGIMPGFALGGRMSAMMAAARQIDAENYPYKWGGGHDSGFTPPYDCSGAVSAVLHAGGALGSPRVASDFMSFGKPGPGAVTLFASPKHVYMRLGSSYFGTSTSNPGGGAGFFAGSPRAGFTVRHIGDGGVGGAPGQVSARMLMPPSSILGGLPGSIVNQTGANVAAATASAINKQVKWFGGGGSFTARKPMVIGVGDKGKEHVQITPTGKAGKKGSAIQLHVHIGQIVSNEKGDIKKIVQREFEDLAEQLAGISLEGDEDLLL